MTNKSVLAATFAATLALAGALATTHEGLE